MIGKAYTSLMPYYDRVTGSMKYKRRPCLIIGKADSGDYVVLPISSVTDRSRIDPVYDVPLDTGTYCFLKKDSFLRAHKQTVVNSASLKDMIADFKADYPETYVKVPELVEQFQKHLIAEAL